MKTDVSWAVVKLFPQNTLFDSCITRSTFRFGPVLPRLVLPVALHRIEDDFANFSRDRGSTGIHHKNPKNLIVLTLETLPILFGAILAHSRCRGEEVTMYLIDCPQG